VPRENEGSALAEAGTGSFYFVSQEASVFVMGGDDSCVGGLAGANPAWKTLAV